MSDIAPEPINEEPKPLSAEERRSAIAGLHGKVTIELLRMFIWRYEATVQQAERELFGSQELVDQLRERVEAAERAMEDLHGALRDERALLNTQKDELEKRAEAAECDYEDLGTCVEQIVDDYHRLEAELARVKEALREVMELVGQTNESSNCDSGNIAILRAIFQTSRAALAEVL